MRERVFLDALGMFAQLVAVRQGREATAIAGHQRAGQTGESRLQRFIDERLRGRTEEIVMLVLSVGIHSGTSPEYQTMSPSINSPRTVCAVDSCGSSLAVSSNRLPSAPGFTVEYAMVLASSTA